MMALVSMLTALRRALGFARTREHDRPANVINALVAALLAGIGAQAEAWAEAESWEAPASLVGCWEVELANDVHGVMTWRREEGLWRGDVTYAVQGGVYTDIYRFMQRWGQWGLLAGSCVGGRGPMYEPCIPTWYPLQPTQGPDGSVSVSADAGRLEIEWTNGEFRSPLISGGRRECE